MLSEKIVERQLNNQNIKESIKKHFIDTKTTSQLCMAAVYAYISKKNRFFLKRTSTAKKRHVSEVH